MQPDLKATLAEKDKRIATLEGQLKEKEKAVAEREKAIADHQQTIKARELAVGEKNKVITELREMVRQEQAEMDNVRARAKEDVKKAQAFALQKFAKDLLEPLDTMQHALVQIKKDLQQHPQLGSAVEGIEMMQNNLLKTLEKHGVKQVCPVLPCLSIIAPVRAQMSPLGQKFDPNFHEGIFAYEDDSKEPGTVGQVRALVPKPGAHSLPQVMKPGYMLHDRCLRPATVGTIRASAAPAAATAAAAAAAEATAPAAEPTAAPAQSEQTNAASPADGASTASEKEADSFVGKVSKLFK